MQEAEESLATLLTLEPRHLQIIHEVLQKSIPKRTVWAFGSRASRRHLKRFSDLDLAVEGELTRRERSTLIEDFDESLLPIKVDIVELGMVDAEFAERIRRDFVAVQGS